MKKTSIFTNGDVIRKRFRKYCYYPGCHKKYLPGCGQKFYSMPTSEPDRLMKWKLALGVPANVVFKYKYVCSDHFYSFDILNNGNLSPIAVPKPCNSHAATCLRNHTGKEDSFEENWVDMTNLFDYSKVQNEQKDGAVIESWELNLNRERQINILECSVCKKWCDWTYIDKDEVFQCDTCRPKNSSEKQDLEKTVQQLKAMEKNYNDLLKVNVILAQENNKLKKELTEKDELLELENIKLNKALTEKNDLLLQFNKIMNNGH